MKQQALALLPQGCEGRPNGAHGIVAESDVGDPPAPNPPCTRSVTYASTIESR